MSSTEPAVDPGPFDLPGTSGAAALCLHGLTGTPYEIRSLGEALSAAGVRAVGPVLPGHNDTPERLARVRYGEWLECARGHLRELQRQHSPVFCVGLSMGGLLTLALAAEESPDAVVAVGSPLRLRQPLPLLMPLLKHLRPLQPKKGGSDIRDPAARERHPGYSVMPLAAVHELIRLQRRVQAQLPRISAPLLVAHGAHDSTANPADARAIHAGVGSAERQLLLLADSAHVVPVDHDAPRLAAAVVDFLKHRIP